MHFNATYINITVNTIYKKYGILQPGGLVFEGSLGSCITRAVKGGLIRNGALACTSAIS
jgi:hypothetical protein